MQHPDLHGYTESAISMCANAQLMDIKGIESDQAFIRSLVEWSGHAPSRLAKEAGLAATTITRAFNGTATTRISKPTIEKLQDRYPQFPYWPEEYRRTVLSEVAGFSDRPRDEKFGKDPLAPVPLLGSAIAMESFDPERHIELTEVDMAEVLDTVARPISLVRDKEAYALTIVGDSMWPRFRPGRRVIISPKSAVSIGDDVIVQLRGTDGDGDHRDRVAMVLVKELVKQTAEFVELRQFNPDVTFRVPRDRVAAIHRVVGEVF